jgi:hypothetical protein
MSKRYYFEIPSHSVLDYVVADSFIEAKRLAAEEYLPYWQDLRWIGSVEGEHVALIGEANWQADAAKELARNNID